MTFKGYFDHTEPIFNELQILNIYKINDYLTSLFMVKYFHLITFWLIKKSIITIQGPHHYCTKIVTEQIMQNTLLQIKI
jgi:hypothetical protein